MKKIFIFFLILLLACSIFCGCPKTNKMEVIIVERTENIWYTTTWYTIGDFQYPQIIEHVDYDYLCENNDHVQYKHRSSTKYEIGQTITIIVPYR